MSANYEPVTAHWPHAILGNVLLAFSHGTKY